VNTASQCGFTPQFKGLEALYQKYKDRNFVILGFPSADFHQEFSDEQKTSEVCYQNYGVTFPMFKASPVRGDDANVFFKKLAYLSGTTPKWNFYKYLIDANGKVVESYASMTTPEDEGLRQKIEGLLAKP
jgi:glutathione peroxidase